MTAVELVTGGAIQARATGWARVLRGRFGVAAGDRVAVLSGDRSEVLELLFACGTLGAALVPLNRRLADAELGPLWADCQPMVAVADEAGAPRVPAGLPLLHLDRPRPAGTAATRPAPEAPPAPPADQAPALILYTSGTTGRPKGAVLPWRQIRFNARSTARRLTLGPRDRCLACLPLCHTGGLNCLATPLCLAGGSLALLDRFDPEVALDTLERDGVTCTIAVPAMVRMLLDAGLARRRLPRLRTILVGGAPLPDSLRDACRAAGYPLAQGYGATEAGPNCFTFGDADVGRPMPGTEARVVDTGGRDVADDQVGELWLSGPHLAAGYWRLPRATARAFAGGWFKTGDLVRRDAGGRYTVVGRLKDMYISGGENVYPAEVERVLAAHPGVAEVAVVGVPDGRWGEVGLAAVVPVADARFDPGELRAWADRRLARFKVPRHVHLMASLPRGATHKVAKHEIAAAFAARKELS